MRVRVEFLHDGLPVVVEAPEFALGRVRACEIRVEHPLVSRRHCRFEVDDRGITVIDLGSSNGTYIDDERIERRRLQPGDGVRIGLGGPELVVVRVTVDDRTVLTIDPEELQSTMMPGAASAAIGGPARITVTEMHTSPPPPAPQPAAATASQPESPPPPPAPPRPAPHDHEPPTEGPPDARPESLIVLTVRGKERTVHRSAALLGRDDDCDVVFSSSVVSRRHCELVVGREGALVRDLGSRGGTWVNGRRVRGEAAIGIGSALQLGEDGPTVRLVRAEAGGRALPGPTSHQGGHGDRARDSDDRDPLLSSGGRASNPSDSRAERLPARAVGAPEGAPGSRRPGCLGRAAVLLAVVTLAALATACAAL